ncbi:DUF7673 family protein [Variovorax saccharolyticus]|uniref:DUF7673 family protein n=1 Tax=Variovorax saccharolyticus TaxID=3053516 RepID=UPI002576D9D7|nr:hypothetical protein [Variovorax sp. J31P216]MDM0030503.1 hypothetical protein [Variovorax sp. J31P216]
MNAVNKRVFSMLDYPESDASRAAAVRRRAGAAMDRLLVLAEQGCGAEIECVAQFLASTYSPDVFAFDPFDLRRVNVATSDDMLLCLDALRWGRAELYELIPYGEMRIQDVMKDWRGKKRRGPHEASCAGKGPPPEASVT